MECIMLLLNPCVAFVTVIRFRFLAGHLLLLSIQTLLLVMIPLMNK